MNHDTYSDAYIRSILRTTKTVAMVGASANEARTSWIVLKYLLARGYRVFPINPRLAVHYGLSSQAQGPERARVRRWGASDYRPEI